MEKGYGTVGADGYEPAAGDSPSDLIIRENKAKKKLAYPYSVFVILSNEFCERFSYYGLRAILVLYLTRWLNFGDSQATSMFHGFSMLCYMMPLFGAVLADGYWGRYKTILILSVVYFIGSLTLSLTAIPPPEVIGPAIGLVLIAIGTGGIKSNVAPFGADQFEEGQEKERNSFFSAFYFMINLGSMISIIITPLLRADAKCFGGECYLLAFGLPAMFMLIAILLFISGSYHYKRHPPTGSIVGKTICCIVHALKGRIFRSSYEGQRKHWLYYADDRYDGQFIEDVRQLLKVLLMFLPLPFFWALSNQQGSRWTLQAEHMDGNMGVFGTLKPDQMQALNPVLILLLIPLFDKVIYPLLDACRIPNRPLQRMVVGLFISSFAFVAAGIVQMKIDNVEVIDIEPGNSGLTFLNTLPCSVNIQSPDFTATVPSHQMSSLIETEKSLYEVQAEATCRTDEWNRKFVATLEVAEGKMYRVILYETDEELTMKQFEDLREKPQNGDAALSIFSMAPAEIDQVSLVVEENDNKGTELGTTFNITQYDATDFQMIQPDEYLIIAPGQGSDEKNRGVKIALSTGGVYTAVLKGDENQMDAVVFTDLKENLVSIAWQIPQYVLITIGEVLFSISGLSFAYSQAPSTLKSVVQALWLATTGVGDMIVIIIANIHAINSQMAEFLLFACLMFIDTLIFMMMAMFYRYKPNSLYTKLDNEEDMHTTEVKKAEDRFKTSPELQSESDTELLPLHLRKMTVTPVN